MTGRATTKLELQCGRCLEDFQVPVDARFELRYVPAVENAGEGEREIAEDDLTTAFYREGALDVIDLLREQFQLALPMKPLCSEACRGLCPECGANLNRTDCGCAPKWEDPRLAPLKSDSRGTTRAWSPAETDQGACLIPNGGIPRAAPPSAARTTR